ncbi:MAG: GAF and ANTAR domain-containing protein [Actinomycetota bacterium]|nr:GAF and ANTAR domain-containing protein [Actinomycetota bacterium]
MSNELVEAITALSRVLLTDQTLGGDLRRIVAVAERTVPGCDGASIALTIEGRPRTEAATDRVVLELDLAQYEADEGPCLLALREARPVRLDLIGEEGRFETFAERAAGAGVRSSLSLPVIVDDEAVGTMNLYSYTPAAFDRTSQSMAAVLVAQAGVAIAKSRLLEAGRRTADVAQQAADDRADVNMAEGILMSLEQCTAQQATALLGNAATSEEQTLAAMARRIIAEVDLGAGDQSPP